MPDLTFTTSITNPKTGEVRGVKLEKLISNYTFTQAIFLLLHGRLPNESELQLFNAMLVAGIDHGPGPASAFVARSVVSTGNPPNSALAAGILAIGDYHGGAIEKAMQTFAQLDQDPATLVSQTIANKQILFGFGHKKYKKEDPRTTALEQKAQSLNLEIPHLNFARAIEQELEHQKGKKLVLNIDGTLAALLLDLGFTNSKLGKLFFALSRAPGLIAHILEELENEKPVRRLPDSQITFKPSTNN